MLAGFCGAHFIISCCRSLQSVDDPCEKEDEDNGVQDPYRMLDINLDEYVAAV